MGPDLQLEEEPIKDMEQRAEYARNNFDRGKNVHKTHYQIKVVDNVIDVDSDSESDYDEDSDYIPKIVKK